MYEVDLCYRKNKGTLVFLTNAGHAVDLVANCLVAHCCLDSAAHCAVFQSVTRFVRIICVEIGCHRNYKAIQVEVGIMSVW